MTLQLLGGWLAVNAGLLLVIGGIVMLWKHTRPLTGRQLAKKIEKEQGADPDRPDFTLGELAFLLRDTGRLAGTRLLTAVLTDLQTRGAIGCGLSPKKKLVSFGADEQPTLTFLLEDDKALTGAAAGFYAMLKHAATDGSLQAGEGYNWARAHAAELTSRLDQYEIEGRSKLRADGCIRQDAQKVLFGLGRQERRLYTPRGTRRAQAMKLWENHLREHPEDDLAAAVLFGFITPPGAECDPPAFLEAFCASFVKGYVAGLGSRI